MISSDISPLFDFPEGPTCHTSQPELHCPEEPSQRVIVRMRCCLNPPWRDPHHAYNSQTSDGLSRYPGQRAGFVKTGGNAPAYNPTHRGNQHSDGSLVSVTVPPGVSPGQTIHLSSPDGSGAMVSAVVPQGMTTGSTFMVNFTQLASPTTAPIVTGTQQQLNAADPYGGIAVIPPPSAHLISQHGSASVLEPPSTSSDPPYAIATPIPPDSSSSIPFASALGPPPGAAAYPAPVTMSPVATPHVRPVPPPSQTTSGQALMKVRVPPGVAPGSTIHVQVPGENRMIAAQVPPGVREFNVAYEPTSAPTAFTPTSAVPAATQVEKLLLVRVPPGTTIHVQVPGEPGRLLAAKVPPGNTSEFHVSYAPRG